ncbi:MAG TPA: hypothetical protein VHT50_23575 [Mycobacterium sp.]|jgi:hypothetical protein|nr:hypothetical protein [Mycobacterium sp.]
MTTSMPASAKTASNEAVNCPAPIADEDPEPRALFVEAHDEVAGLLGGPRPVGMAG